MKLVTGIDIVDIKDFRTALKQGKSIFLDRVFTRKEQQDNVKLDSLAGVFAAKEAVMKALEIKAGKWKSIQVNKSISGKPSIQLENVSISSYDISITHTKNLAIAVFIAFFE